MSLYHILVGLPLFAALRLLLPGDEIARNLIAGRGARARIPGAGRIG